MKNTKAKIFRYLNQGCGTARGTEAPQVSQPPALSALPGKTTQQITEVAAFR